MIKVLDAGYVNIVDTWGSEEGIIEAARMSTNKGFQGWDTDTKLLSYLYKNKHYTPFEMAGAIIEVKAPIFVFREWHRHRTQSYNELSARYTPMPDDNYMPNFSNVVERGNATTTNKQAQGSQTVSEATVVIWLAELNKQYQNAQVLYEEALKEGIPKELARLIIPVGRYSKMRASSNLRNWLAFLTLRMAANAQWEIRQYANAVHELLEQHFPRTILLFDAENNNAG